MSPIVEISSWCTGKANTNIALCFTANNVIHALLTRLVAVLLEYSIAQHCKRLWLLFGLCFHLNYMHQTCTQQMRLVASNPLVISHTQAHTEDSGQVRLLGEMNITNFRWCTTKLRQVQMTNRKFLSTSQLTVVLDWCKTNGNGNLLFCRQYLNATII